MAEFIQNLDPNSLVVVEAVASFLVSPFTAPEYNLPLFLFGIYAQENADSHTSMKLFTGFLGVSMLFDIIWMVKHEQNLLIRFITIAILLFKGPTFFTFLTALRQRGEQVSGFGIRGNDLGGPTLWSMPGGFSNFGSRNGYDPLDGDRDVESQPTPKPPTHSSAPLAPQATAGQPIAPAPSEGY